MAQAAKAQEPSMEEILASIRRIIADDEKPAPIRIVEPPRPVAAPVAQSEPPASPLGGEMAAEPSAPPQSSPAAPASAFDSLVAPPEPPAPRAEVLELTESMATAVTPGGSPSFRTIDGQNDVVFADPPPPPLPETSAERPSERLLSNAASAAVDSAFNNLTQTVLLQHGRTLEDLVQDMLRPMLKAWLDDNLPGLVERLVRAEIERVSRGRG